MRRSTPYRTPRRRGFSALLRGVPLLFLSLAATHGQDRPQSICAFVNGVASARLYTSPFSNDEIERNSAIDFGFVFSGRLAYSYQLSRSTRIQLSAEYLETQTATRDYNATTFTDGFNMYAIEGAVLFILPFTGERFQIFLGGGGGLYLGSRRYEVAGIASAATRSVPAFNILTVFGMEYFVFPSLSIQMEFRFRDPLITPSNVFEQPSVLSNGVHYPLDQRPFRSRVNVNGNVYSAGVSFHF
ncbi:MAG: outer membrane beta-barrel protein [Ignavibacteriae bacterium]|nr:outer membrane beta-barrel protein [Ignavibacteriota bacterium]